MCVLGCKGHVVQKKPDVLFRPGEVLPPPKRCEWQDKTNIGINGSPCSHPLFLGGFCACARLHIATNEMLRNRALVARMARDCANWGLPTVSASSQHGTHGRTLRFNPPTTLWSSGWHLSLLSLRGQRNPPLRGWRELEWSANCFHFGAELTSQCWPPIA